MYTIKKLIMLLAMLACMSASAQVKFGAKVGLDLTNFWGKECGHQIVLNYQAGLHPSTTKIPETCAVDRSPRSISASAGGCDERNYLILIEA